MKPEYYIYSWQAGAFRSDELSKSVKGYSCRDTAERIAKFRFEVTHDRIRYCVALTDDEAFVEMTRQNMPEKPAFKEDTIIYMDGNTIRAYVNKAFFHDYDHSSFAWVNPSEKKRSVIFGKCFINYYNADGNVYRADNFYMKHPYSTKEFIEYMLAKFPYGWGYIMLHDHGENLVDDAAKCEHVNGYLKTSLPEKYMDREVYIAEACVTFPRMDITIYTY